MSNRPVLQPLFFLILLLLITTAGCMKNGLPIYYYTLDSSSQETASAPASLPNILVGPVHIASFLDQRHLVKQHSAHSLQLVEQHRWAGDLQDMLSNVLIGNLSLALGSDTIYTFPNNQQLEGLQLEINFLHFEEDKDGKAVVEARWKLITSEDNSTFYNSTTSYRIVPETTGYDALAGALSQGLATLTQDIADQIRLFNH